MKPHIRQVLLVVVCVTTFVLHGVLTYAASGGALLSTLLSGGSHTAVPALLAGVSLLLLRVLLWFIVPALAFSVCWELVVSARFKVHSKSQTR